jgi:hypothetical protein
MDMKEMQLEGMVWSRVSLTELPNYVPHMGNSII